MILITAPWCQPCQELKRWLDLTGNGDDVEVITLGDDDVIPEGVRSIPTLLTGDTLYVGNEEIRPFLSARDVVEL
jgi:glutaredoxin